MYALQTHFLSLILKAMKTIKKYLVYFIALNLIILGFDKFFVFIPEACSLMTDGPKNLLYSIGVIEIVLGLFLFFGKFIKPILILVILLMLWAIYAHISVDTTDYGGAIFMGIVALIPLIIPEQKTTLA